MQPDVASWRAAWWTVAQLRQVRRRLRRDGFRTTVPDPPALPVRAERGVRAVLRRRPSTCLERALILQKWLSVHGDRRDVVVGVAASAGNLRAHAWLDGESTETGADYDELLRLPPP